MEAATGGVRSIAESCIRSESVKRLIYTGSVTASSPLKEDGSGFKSSFDESCWTPLNLSFTYSNDYMMVPSYSYPKKFTLVSSITHMLVVNYVLPKKFGTTIIINF